MTYRDWSSVIRSIKPDIVHGQGQDRTRACRVGQRCADRRHTARRALHREPHVAKEPMGCLGGLEETRRRKHGKRSVSTCAGHDHHLALSAADLRIDADRTQPLHRKPDRRGLLSYPAVPRARPHAVRRDGGAAQERARHRAGYRPARARARHSGDRRQGVAVATSVESRGPHPGSRQRS